MNASAVCPLPPWPSTYNLSQSSIVYQPWCIDNEDPDLCTNLINITAWWGRPENRDGSSFRDAHWGLISLDDSTSTLVWQQGAEEGGQPGDVLHACAQEVMVKLCQHVKTNGWADRCFIYDNMVNGLGWYKSHRDKMLNPATWLMFNIMNNQNVSMGLVNLTGLPWQEAGSTTPCWKLPKESPDPTRDWCWPLEAQRLPCYARGDCNTTAGGGGFGMFVFSHQLPRKIRAHPPHPNLYQTLTPKSLPGTGTILQPG
jgi:hypothetical protein